MHKLPVRRTFNIGNYESLSYEYVGEHEDLQKARLIASKVILEVAQQEMIRIFGVRASLMNSSPIEKFVWNQVVMELNGVNTELGS